MILSSPQKLKRGALREDGMVFWGYEKRCRNGQYWLTPEKFLARSKAKKHQEKISRLNNLEKVRATRRAYQNKRKQSDPIFKLIRDTRSTLCRCLRDEGYTKKAKSNEILGCSWNFFKNYIEQRFLLGMTWDNRNLWHVDHIVPLSSAITEREILKLNHYTNLRPLWAKQNLSKGSRLPFEQQNLIAE